MVRGLGHQQVLWGVPSMQWWYKGRTAGEPMPGIKAGMVDLHNIKQEVLLLWLIDVYLTIFGKLLAINHQRLIHMLKLFMNM